MKTIFILILIFTSNCYCQSGRIFNTYKTDPGSTDESRGTIFPQPFQEFNYIKTHRGIELYETYKTKTGSTNQSRGTIFSKPFPKYIIIENKVYETYINYSNRTIFTKPFESKQIFNINVNKNNKKEIKVNYVLKEKELLPRYNGEGEITYGE